MTISIIGLGKLGASLAAAVASRGIPVVGMDLNEDVVTAVNAGRAPVFETGLDEAIADNKNLIRATTNVDEAILASDITFVVVPTPSDESGGFSLEFVQAAFREIGKALARKQDYHLVVLTSTVLPGALRYVLLPELERQSGKRCGEDFGLCYNPAFVALGEAIRNFLNPDLVLIGESDEKAGARLQQFYEKVLENAAPVARMNFENAELAKLAVNTFVTTKISFANMLAEICQAMPGGDVDVVTDAIGMDSRIGRRYLTGAIGYGGPCFPRDNEALVVFAEALGAAAGLARATDKGNRALADRIVDKILPHIQPGQKVAVLGLAYKPGSDCVEESQGIHLVKAIAATGARVAGFDPLATVAARRELNGIAEVADTLNEAVADAHAVLVITPDEAFRSLWEADMSVADGAVLVVDFWRCLADGAKSRPEIEYVAYGTGNAAPGAVNPLQEFWNRMRLSEAV